MDISVQHESRAYAVFLLHGASGCGDIVEDAVTGTAIGKGVMSASGKVSCDLVLQCGS